MSRITIVAPTSRVDLALPADIPLAHLLPTLVISSGLEIGKSTSTPAEWSLARLGQAPFRADRTLTQLQVRDGELLYLQPHDAIGAEAVFDDVVDALVTAQDQVRRWTPAMGARFAVIFGSLALAVGAGSLLLIGPPQGANGAVALAVALVLCLGGVTTGQNRAGNPLALPLALGAVGYAAVGGLLLLAGDRTVHTITASDLLLAGVAAMLTAAIGGVSIRSHAQLLLATALGGLMLAIGAEICVLTTLSGAAAGAIIAVIGLASVPALPMTAFRLARLPMPSVPTGPRDLRSDAQTLEATATLQRSEQASTLLGDLLTGFTLIEVGAVAALALGGDGVGLALAAVLTLLLRMRARAFYARVQRLPLLWGATAGIGLVLWGAFVTLSGPARLAAVAALPLLAVAFTFASAAGADDRPVSPVWARTVDLAELALTASAIPLAAWVCGLFQLA